MQNRIIYPGIAVCSALFFIFSINVFVFHQFLGIFTFAGAACTTAFLAMALNAWIIKDREITTAQIRQRQVLMGVVCAVFAIGYGIFINKHNKAAVAKELDKHGIFAIGTVVDGKSELLSVSEARIFVKYYDENDKSYEAVAYIPKSNFDNFSKDQVVGLRFMPKHPEIIRLLLTDDEMTKYSGFKNRPLQLPDLMEVIQLPRGKRIQDYLNSVNLQWYMKPDEYGINYQYINKMKIQSIVVNQRGAQFINNTIDQNLFKRDIAKYRFALISDSGAKEYQNDNFTLTIQDIDIPFAREHSGYGNSVEKVEYKPVTVYTLTKRFAEDIE